MQQPGLQLERFYFVLYSRTSRVAWTWWKRVVCRSGGYPSKEVYDITTKKLTKGDKLKPVIECYHYDICMSKLNSTLGGKF